MRRIDGAMRTCSTQRGLWLAILTILAWGPANAQKPPPEDIFHDHFELAGSPPANDTCQSAPSILVGTPIMGTTVAASPNYDSGLETCTGFMQSGPDVAYKVILIAGQPITVTLSAPIATFDPSISLVGPGPASMCDAAPLSCLAGADAAGFGAGESFTFTTTFTGTYYIIVDSYYGAPSAGAFTLNVTSP